MRKYLITTPSFGTEYPVDARILNGPELESFLNDQQNPIPTGIYRLDACKDPVRLYVTRSGKYWFVLDRFGNLESFE